MALAQRERETNSAERAPFRLNFYPSILTNLISGIPGFTVGRVEVFALFLVQCVIARLCAISRTKCVKYRVREITHVIREITE